MPLVKNVIKPLAKSVLIPSATDAAIHKKMFWSGAAAIIIANEEINDIMKIVQSLEESGLLIKGVSEANKNEAKEQKGGFLSILLGTLGTSLFANLLTGKGVKRSKISGQKIMQAGEGTIRTGQDS